MQERDDDQFDLIQRRQRLSPTKQSQLERLLQGAPRTSHTEITRHPPSAEALLSPSQERLWFLHRLAPQSTAYHLPLLLSLTGKLEVEILERALQEVVRRHSALRTCFLIREGKPVQVILPDLALPLVYHDISSLPAPQRARDLQVHLEDDLTRPFDLERLPLLRATLLKLNSQDHRLLIVLHHIIADAWSLRIFIRELAAIYGALSTGQNNPLSTLPLQLSDYVSWLQETSSRQERHLAYWQEQLRGAPAMLLLPYDRTRPAVQRYQGAWLRHPLPPSLVADLENLAQQEHVTPYMLFFAAYAILLWRYSGETDLLIGTPLAQRNRSGAEQIIGFIANTLVLRTNISKSSPFIVFLQYVRKMILEAFDHTDVPFEKIVERVRPARDASYQPLFQVMFLYQNIIQAPLHAGDLLIEVENFENDAAQFDLTLAVSKGLCRFQYNTDLFDATTIARMAGHFEELLQSIVRIPNQQIDMLSLLTAAERDQQLLSWNTMQGSTDALLSLHESFELQVKQRPDAIAVIFEDLALSYAELNERANCLARTLQSMGVGPEVLVAVYMDRSLELIIALLAVLKAGGAYLPLGLDYPRERLTFMLQDAQAFILVTQAHLLAELPAHPRTICVDRDWPAISQQSTEDLGPVGSIEQLAYVIYTSGSTGKPKGVQISHANAVRLFKACPSWFHCTEHDIWTMFHSVAFDFSVWEIWGALLSGGRVVVVPYWVSRSPESFYTLLREKGVTVLSQTPSAFRQLIQFEEAQTTQQQLALRLVIFGGEALDTTSLRPWFARYGDQVPQLVNMYGITETTVHVTYHALAQETSGSPIGRPLADLQAYVLDSHLQLLPCGVPGELYVGGAGVARGYLSRPALTAERFIPHPFSQQAGARLYRTGDLARFNAEGELEYLGRIDQQVKIRGFRIELEEIEMAIEQHPDVNACKVLVQIFSADDQRLVGYVIPRATRNPASDELRAFLRSFLPEYMIPSSFLCLEAWPLLPSGKIDRQALSSIQAPNQVATESPVAPPRTALERALADIWREILRVEHAGLHDNFFDLGGHSLLMIQVNLKVNHLIGRSIPLLDFFQYSTIHSLAEHLQTSQSAEQDVPIDQIKSAVERQRSTTRRLQQKNKRERLDLSPENIKSHRVKQQDS